MGENEYDIENYDMDNDGKVSSEDITLAKMKYDEERLNRRQYHQRRMAWTAILSIVVFTLIMFLPIVPDARIKILGEVSSMFYITMAGIVGAFMGVTAWMSKK